MKPRSSSSSILRIGASVYILVVIMIMGQYAPVVSYSFGAGACPKGISAAAAAGSPHGAGQGSLSAAGNQTAYLTLNGQFVTDSTITPLDVFAGSPNNLELRGFFKGFLIRLDTTASTAINPNNAASVCASTNGVGFTHTSSGFKRIARATLNFDQVGATYQMDVTVVIQNLVWYYSNYTLIVKEPPPSPEPSTFPTVVPTVIPTAFPFAEPSVFPTGAPLRGPSPTGQPTRSRRPSTSVNPTPTPLSTSSPISMTTKAPSVGKVMKTKPPSVMKGKTTMAPNSMSMSMTKGKGKGAMAKARKSRKQ